MDDDAISAIEVESDTLHVETTDVTALGASVPRIASDHGVRLVGFEPEDESLESVFRYLVRRRR